MEDVINKIVISVASTLGVAALSLLFESVRNAFIYTRTEYDLDAVRKPGESPFPRSWSIHWEDNKLEFSVEDISNEKLKNVVFVRNRVKETKLDVMYPSDRYAPILEGSLQVKVNTIIRADAAKADGTRYTIRLVVRRRRWRL